MDKLKELLGADLYAQVEAKLGKDRKYVFGVLGESDNDKDFDFVTRARFKEINEESKILKSNLADRDAQLVDLSKKAKGNEELSNQIKTLQENNEKVKAEYEAKLLNTKRDYSLDDALRIAGARNPKAIKALLDNEKIIYKDGKLTGLTDQLEGLLKSDPYLFNEQKGNESQDFGRGTPPPNNMAKTEKKDFSTMSYKELVELKKNNPTLFAQSQSQD